MQNSTKQYSRFIESSSPTAYYDFDLSHSVPSVHIVWDSRFMTEEATDDDVRKYVAQSPAFEFLNDPQEDIYTAEDGSPIWH